MIYDFEPGDGTRYNLVTVDDPHGGVLVICNNSSLWRYYQDDYLKFLCGNENEYTRRAIFNHLERLKPENPGVTFCKECSRKLTQGSPSCVRCGKCARARRENQ